METIGTIISQGNIIKNETQTGVNTATRVGKAIVDVAEYLEAVEDTLEAGALLSNIVIVNTANAATTLGGLIDSTKQYFLDGIVDMGSSQVVVPVGGITLRGFSNEISGLVSSEDTHTLFVSESELIGSGTVLGFDFYIEVTGTGSRVYDLYDATGFNAFEFNRVNYNNCTSLGNLYNYRQGLEDGTGRFGGSPSLTLHGTWVGGYKIVTSIVRSMSDTTTEPLFKAGTAFVMNSRFYTDMNVDLGTLQALLDFAPSNFTNTDTLQLQNMLVTRDFVANASDVNITPNISHSDVASYWLNNSGAHNTFVGAMGTVSTEALTTITEIDTAVDLEGVQTITNAQHFDEVSNGKLRLIGNIPVAYSVTFNFILEGASNNTYEIELIKSDGGVETVVQRQKRVVNNLQGGRDVAYFNGVFNVDLHNTDYVYWKVGNKTSTGDCTLELDSMWHITKR